MSFKYDKTNLFKEFEVAKNKDIALSKLDTLEEKENDVYKNRIQFFKDHIELKKTNPSYYSDLDINFDSMTYVQKIKDINVDGTSKMLNPKSGVCWKEW